MSTSTALILALGILLGAFAALESSEPPLAAAVRKLDCQPTAPGRFDCANGVIVFWSE